MLLLLKKFSLLVDSLYHIYSVGWFSYSLCFALHWRRTTANIFSLSIFTPPHGTYRVIIKLNNPLGFATFKRNKFTRKDFLFCCTFLEVTDLWMCYGIWLEKRWKWEWMLKLRGSVLRNSFGVFVSYNVQHNIWGSWFRAWICGCNITPKQWVKLLTLKG